MRLVARKNARNNDLELNITWMMCSKVMMKICQMFESLFSFLIKIVAFCLRVRNLIHMWVITMQIVRKFKRNFPKNEIP